MRREEHTISFQFFDDVKELDSSWQELLEAARKASMTADARYSKFSVGASARLSTGQIILGSNQENAVFGLTVCAEHNVISTIGSLPERQLISSIAITASHRDRHITEPIFPCGACRQVIREQEEKQRSSISILLQGQTGPCLIFASADDLLPFAFTGSVLIP